jgi:hypothetical protein
VFVPVSAVGARLNTATAHSGCERCRRHGTGRPGSRRCPGVVVDTHVKRLSIPVSRSEMRIFVQDQRNRGPAAKQWGLSTRSGAKKTKGLRGDVRGYVACLPCRHRQAQARPPFDTEIGQKDPFRMETS